MLMVAALLAQREVGDSVSIDFPHWTAKGFVSAGWYRRFCHRPHTAMRCGFVGRVRCSSTVAGVVVA